MKNKSFSSIDGLQELSKEEMLAIDGGRFEYELGFVAGFILSFFFDIF